jgi:hypothetical protein
MQMAAAGAYIPGTQPSRAEPLSRYLPPLADGVVSAWLRARLPMSERRQAPWILDPFCASPRSVIEAARAGFNVLVAANNPISRYLLEMAANPPTEDELRSALAELAAARKGDERLELHIRSLYTTTCDVCKSEIMAEAYLWDRDKNQPFARIYNCPHCGTSGEHPILELDLSRLSQFSSSGLHHSRALERVAAIDDPDRQHVKEALDVYLPRALYALFTIINRLESLPINQAKRHHLSALILAALDQANTLWQYPTSRARPRQLTIPPRFRENNVWLALENAVELWAPFAPSIPLVRWPEIPPATGGISVFEGRLSELGISISDLKVEAVLAPLPRPNQAFWTLSALWAGWLWGKEALGPFKNVLRRRRYDWSWHGTALHAALESLHPILDPGTPVLGLIGENEPGFLSAAIISAEAAGFDLDSLAMRLDSAQAQIVWHRPPGTRAKSYASGAERIRLIAEAARNHLQERGEPASFLTMQAAALTSVIHQHVLDLSPPLTEVIPDVNNLLDSAFSYRRGFIRYGGSEKSLDIGQWWLEESKEIALSLADRVEKEAVRQLLEFPGGKLLEFDTRLCQEFPGLLTPNSELVHVCLESYGEPINQEDSGWQMRRQDMPEVRRNDLKEISSALVSLTSLLDHSITGDKPLLVYNAQGELQYAIYIIASALIGEYIFARKFPPEKSLIVIPGGRANLVAYKLQHDPRLRLAIESGWRFMKFRQVRELIQSPRLTKFSLEDQLALDSLTYDAPQLRLF